jgi:glucose/arabinose dehydrogenase
MRSILAVIAVLAVAGCSPQPAAAPQAEAAPAALTAQIDGQRLHLETVASGLDRPLFVTAPVGDPRLFIVEKTGRIRILADQLVAETPFLDLSGLVSDGGEQGLLGLAFHPGYAENRFFVNYTDKEGDTRIVAYRVSSDAGRADPASARELLRIAQPYDNHNGGWLGFGPDGLLYVGVGDGGSGGDPQGNGQNKDSLLGKMLRIDVDGAEPYAIPPGNPFANGGGAPEIYLTGLRNPWRNSFDGDLLYIADVGQNAFEEINVVGLDAAGANLGWNTIEGTDCFPAGATCVQGGFHLPVHTYSHDDGCSITGGYVYRGEALPALQGRYFFADYCTGVLESFRYVDGAVTGLLKSPELGELGSFMSFGTDAAGELYLMRDDGRLLRLVPAT